MSDAQPEAPDEAQAAVHGDEQSDTHPEASGDPRAAADPTPGRPEDGPRAESVTTADPRVDDALSRLGELGALPLAEQVEVYTDIHRRLAAVLSDPDSQA